VVRQRRELNSALLGQNCAFDAAPPFVPSPGDVSLLRRIASERFGGEHALMRRQAIHALGRAKTIEAVNALVGLALSPAEHDGASGDRAPSSNAASRPSGSGDEQAARATVAHNTRHPRVHFSS
jgi:hypothetical protein